MLEEGIDCSCTVAFQEECYCLLTLKGNKRHAEVPSVENLTILGMLFTLVTLKRAVIGGHYSGECSFSLCCAPCTGCSLSLHHAQVGGAGLAVIDKAESGPLFGAEGLSIPLQQGQERVGKSLLGSYYARRADGGRTLFAVGEEKRAQLVDLKVRFLFSSSMRSHALQPSALRRMLTVLPYSPLHLGACSPSMICSWYPLCHDWSMPTTSPLVCCMHFKCNRVSWQ